MDSSNAQKTPLARALNATAQRRALDAIAVTGRALPAHVVAVSGSIVTVAFDVSGPWTIPNVTCPIQGPEYIRMPTRVGDKGCVFPADASLGGNSGLGSGLATIPSLPANLSAVVFFPFGNSTWTATDDPNAVVIYGPNGAIIRDTGGNSKVTVTPSLITLEATTINLNGTVMINGHAYLMHEHTLVQSGTDV